MINDSFWLFLKIKNAAQSKNQRNIAMHPAFAACLAIWLLGGGVINKD
jgi:hypothetical protein